MLVLLFRWVVQRMWGGLYLGFMEYAGGKIDDFLLN